MNRISKCFEQLKIKNEKGLITYITAGDPNLDITKNLVLQMEESGADIIEIGIPYSDPVADGPVIQRAAERALNNKVKISSIMKTVEDIRKQSEVPLLFLVYFNCILQYGIEKFLEDCSKVGIDGLIIPDVPFEESEDLRFEASKYDIDIIPLIAPTSHNRIENILKIAKGFVYCVSSSGVTGTRSSFKTDFSSFIGEIKKFSNIPTALGFGICSPEQVKELKEYTDALIVGSAIVKIIEDYGSSKELLNKVGEFVGKLKNACY